MADRLPCKPAHTFRRRAASLAVSRGLILTVFGTTVLPSAGTAFAQTAADARTYAIPAGPLENVLTRFALESGLMLSYGAADIAGKRSPGLTGSHSAPAALKALLTGTGLAADQQSNGGYVLRAVPTSAPRPAAREGEVTLPTVKVTARPDVETATGPVSGYVAKRSATATRTDTPLIETPQSISVVGREEMDARGVQDVMDAIRYTPGITTNIYGPDNRSWEDIQIRGFSSYYSSYRDGLAQIPAGVTYYLTESYGLERVEVLRGPSSMIYGQGDAGGIITRVSKQPTGERIREVELQYGSHARQQLAVDFGDRIADSDLSFRVVALALDSNDQDRYPDGHELNRKRQYLVPSLRWQPTADTSLTLFGEYLNNRSPEDAYYLNANGAYTRLKMGDYSFSRLRQEQGALGYRFETELAANWSLAQSLRYSHIAMDRRVVWIDSLDADERTLHRIARTWNDPLSLVAVDTHLQGRLRTGEAEHTVLLGIDWNEQTARARRFVGSAPDLDLYLPVYGQPVALPTEPLANYRQTTRQAGFYAQDQIKWADRWVLTLGGRQDKVKSATRDTLNDSNDRQGDSAFSSRAGLTYLLGNGLAPYLGYAESFLPNNGLDAQNNPFKPSRGKQVEVGIKYQPTGRNALFTAALFDLRKTNVVTYDPVTYDGRQIGRQRSRGVELEAKGEVLPRLNVSAAYTWLDMQVLQSADPGEIGKSSPGVPRQSASVWLDYAFNDGWGLGAGARYIGKRANDEYNTSFVEEVTLLDAALRYTRGPWRLALNVGNLTNKKYFSICYHGECYRGAERNATLSARYSF